MPIPDFLHGPVEQAARLLVGWEFYVRAADGSLCGGRIIETEAYGSQDAASHSFRGQTPRNAPMFQAAGHLYVYFTYGMHWCMNIVSGLEGTGEAVLIRALEPLEGIQTMRHRRGGKPDKILTDGPAKLCQALGTTGADSGSKIDDIRFILKPPSNPPKTITATPRIGIQQNKDALLRFIL